jgi:pyruvate,water dikinase
VGDLYWLDRIQSQEIAQVGDKAFALSEILQLGYPVFPGFAIPTSILQEFLQNIVNCESLLADFPHSSIHIDLDNSQALQSVAQQIRQQIVSATLPSQWQSIFLDAGKQLDSPNLILRPSFTLQHPVGQDFSNLVRSYLCSYDRDNLALAIKQTWSELFRARCLFYFQHEGIKLEEINLAVLVQPIQNAIASGIVEIEKDYFNVRSTWGLGQSLLRGEVLPDFYRIARKTGKILDRRLGNKTIAYRLKKTVNSLDWQNYVLNEVQRESYVLDDFFLNKAIELIEDLLADREYTGLLKWTLIQTKANSEAQFYITQVSPYLSFDRTTVSSPAKRLLMANREPLLKGLGVSPGQATAPAQIISGLTQHLQAIPKNRILVVKTITADWLPLIRTSKGIILEQGGTTSHAAIIARELGIPSIVGVTGATHSLETGEILSIDGSSGEIRKGEITAPIQELEDKNKQTSPPTPLLQGEGRLTIATQLLVNLSQSSSIATAAALPIDGVGLIRSELMLSELISSKPLSKWLKGSRKSILLENLTQLLVKIAAAFAPRPIFYRSIDLHSSESPLILHRGTHNYLLDPTLFDLELAALASVRAKGYANVNLILPFVRSVEEFSFCRLRVEQIGLTQDNSFQLWIMAEVPSVIFLLPEYVKAGVRGISIGTNDLTQLLLGIDREQTSTTNLNPLHPAMLAALKQLVTVAKDLGIPCSICGEASVQYPELIDKLIAWGITSISVAPEAVEKTYRSIARAEQRLILETARKQ